MLFLTILFVSLVFWYKTDGGVSSTVIVRVSELLMFFTISVAVNVRMQFPLVALHPRALAVVVDDQIEESFEVDCFVIETVDKFPTMTVEPVSKLVSFTVTFIWMLSVLLTLLSASFVVMWDTKGFVLSIVMLSFSELFLLPALSVALNVRVQFPSAAHPNVFPDATICHISLLI